MSDLASMIREYYDAAAEPVEAAEILAGEMPELQERPRQWRPVWAAAAAAVAVLVAIGAVGIPGLLGSGDPIADDAPEPTVVSVVTTTVPATPTTAPPPTPVEVSTTLIPALDLSAREWVAAPDTGAVFASAQVYDAAPLSDGMIAVGSVWTDGRPTAAMWSTPDGRAWSRVVDDGDVFDPGAFEIWAVASDGERLVAVGHGCDDPDGPCAMRPTVWMSSDGVVWQRIEHDPAVFGLGGQMTDVVFHRGRWISVGMVCDETSCVPAAWGSDDGVSWELAWTGEAGTRPEALISDSTTLVAVGSALLDGGGVAAAWTSADGVEWSRAPHIPAAFGSGGPTGEFFDVAMTSVARHCRLPEECSFVAAGWTISDPGQQQARIWASDDGMFWTVVFDAPSQGVASHVAVGADDSPIVVVGTGIWRSDDDMSWEAVSDHGWFKAVAVGSFGWASLTGDAGDVWVSPPSP